jgi:hypothetical protein
MDKNYRRIDQLRAIALDCGFRQRRRQGLWQAE